MTGRYELMFAARPAGIVVPFLVLGDPALPASLELALALADAGADALELGIPFSDPVADGPVIQRAAARALAAGATPPRCLALVAALRRRHPALPIGLLAYANTVVRPGIGRFYRAAAGAGADSVLVADVPSVEAAPFVAAARAEGLHHVCVVPPEPGPGAIRYAAGAGGGYTYLQGRPGVTGTDAPMRMPDARVTDALRAAGAPPSLVGFGVSRREHLEAALAAGAVGVIVGSAIVAEVERTAGGGTSAADAVVELLARLQAGQRTRSIRTSGMEGASVASPVARPR